MDPVYTGGERRRVWHTYDAARRLVLWRFDHGSDGPEDDSTTEFEYEGNRMVRQVATWPEGGAVTTFDFDCD